jgi:hypothetical protein
MIATGALKAGGEPTGSVPAVGLSFLPTGANIINLKLL